MFRSAVHLTAFAEVAVLCICMVTSVPDSSTVLPTSSSPNITVSGSDAKTPADTHTPDQNKSTTDAVTSKDTQPPHGRTNTDGQLNVTHQGTTKEPPKNTSTTIKSTTTEATTAKATTTESTTTEGKQSVGVKVEDGSSSVTKAAGIFVLLLIIFIIFSLAVILYVLWKKGKRYSFDLTNGEHDTPLRSMEHTGTFEPSKGSTMNLDYVQEEKTNKTSPVANGCSGETPDQTPCSEHQNVPEEDSFSSDLSLDLPVKKVEFNLDLELIGGDPEPVKEATVETTDNDNENNNNDTNTGIDSADFFTEINLDDVQ